MANSILGTIDLFQRQQQRNFQNALAQANYELAVQREERLAKQQKTADTYAANQEARAVKQDTRLDNQEARAADKHPLEMAALKLTNEQGQVALDTSKLELKDKQQDFDRKTRGFNSGDTIRLLDANRWIDRSKQPVAGASVYTDSFWNAVGENDSYAINHLKEQAGKALNLPDGMSISSIQVMPVGEDGVQRFAINTSNGGVITEDASSRPDSTPIMKTADELDRLLSTSLRSTALADVVDTAGANLAFDMGKLTLNERSARRADDLSGRVNQATRQVTQALSQDKTEEGAAALRAFNQIVTDIHEDGGDEAVLEFVNSFMQDDQEDAQTQTAPQDTQQVDPNQPTMPGGVAPEPFVSEADTEFARESEESAAQRLVDNRRISGTGAFRGERPLTAVTPGVTIQADPLVEDIRSEVRSTESGFFKRRAKSTREETEAANAANAWYKQNADALGARFANAPDAIHTEITSLGAVGFYQKYKDIDVANFSPEVMNLNAKVTQATGNTVAGTKAAIERGALPTPTAEEIRAVADQLRARGFTNQSTSEELDKLQNAEIPGLMAVMVGMAENTTDRMNIFKAFENRIQTGNMSTTPDDVRRTDISAGTLQLQGRKFNNDLFKQYGDDAQAVIDKNTEFDTLIINEDGSFADPPPKARAMMTEFATLATNRSVSQGTRDAANEAFLQNLVNYLAASASDNAGFLSALAFWRDDPFYAAGNVRPRIRVTPNEIILIDGEGNPVADGTFSKGDAQKYLGTRAMELLDSLVIEPE